jgi:hypothetical protein
VYHARKSAKNSQSFSSLKPFSKIMNNGDTVTKKDFTASFKSKKEEVFESSGTKIWHEIKANVLMFWGQVLL